MLWHNQETWIYPERSTNYLWKSRKAIVTCKTVPCLRRKNQHCCYGIRSSLFYFVEQSARDHVSFLQHLRNGSTAVDGRCHRKILKAKFKKFKPAGRGEQGLIIKRTTLLDHYDEDAMKMSNINIVSFESRYLSPGDISAVPTGT